MKVRLCRSFWTSCFVLNGFYSYPRHPYVGAFEVEVQKCSLLKYVVQINSVMLFSLGLKEKSVKRGSRRKIQKKKALGFELLMVDYHNI